MAVKSLGKTPIVVLIGGGSKLPPLIKAAQSPKNNFKISLVVTHKRNSPGIDYALKHNIPAVFFNLTDYRTRLHKEPNNARKSYAELLGWFISQKEYAPKLLVFAGWDLIMDNNFFKFFKSDIGNGYSAINIHPALMKTKFEKDKVKLPNDSSIPVIKGEQQEVLETVLREKHSYFGPSVHFMNPNNFDEGTVITREFIKVGNSKTPEDLRKKLMPVEDKILISAINIAISKFLK